jgi:hypothetical protein
MEARVIRISDRDKRLFDLLARYEIVDSKRIRQMLFSEIPATNFFRRLRELEQAKMIRRIGPMMDHSYAWLLGPRGKEMMGFDERDLIKTRFTIEHDVTVTQVRMGLDTIGLGHDFTSESELRKREVLRRTDTCEKNRPVVVPDGLFPVLIGEERRLFALEVELHFKNRLRYEDLFKRYLKTDGLYSIWYVVPSKSMGERLLYEWEAFFKRFRGEYARKRILCYTELDSFRLDPRNALLRDHQGEVKICDWWKLDHLHGQAIDHRVIDASGDFATSSLEANS